MSEIPARGEEEGGGNKRKEAGDNEGIRYGHVVPAYAIAHYIVVTVTIAAGTTAEQVSEEWERMLFKALDLCHKTDRSVCLLQPNDLEYGKRIYTKSDAPALFQGW